MSRLPLPHTSVTDGQNPPARRIRKRITIHFGRAWDSLSPGFTLNLSSSGLALNTMAPLPKGTRVCLRLQLPCERTCQLQGTVVWARRGIPQLREQGIMGLALLPTDTGYSELLTELQAGQPAGR